MSSVVASSSPADHPRIRGEHFGLIGRAHQMSGSSPHTRGALVTAYAARLSERIIPAYAGSTELLTAKKLNDTDHPRIRGEHEPEPIKPPTGDGSSPHTRGAPLLGGLRLAPGRIIPAYAGSTAPSSPACRWRWDHPRIRGEHEPPVRASGVEGGSSPHTRGAHQRAPVWARHQGIIPAYAGSTTP